MDKRQLVIVSSSAQKFSKIANKAEENGLDFSIHGSIDEVIKLDVNLVIIDTNIGNKEVIRTIKKLKNEFLKVKLGIIICTDKENIMNLKEYIEIGADDYILKPFSFDEIDLRISNQIKLMKAQTNSKIKDIQFDALLNNTPFMAWFKDKDSNYIKVNNEFMEHSGKTMNQIKGNGDHYVWSGMVGDRCRQFDLEVMNKRTQVVFDEIIPGEKGFKQFNMYKAPVINEFDEVIGTIGIARDITDLKNKDAKLQMLMDNLPFPVWLTDINAKYVNGNKKFADYFSVSMDKLIGRIPHEFFGEDIVKDIYSQNKEVMEAKETRKFESDIKINNEIRSVEIYKTPVLDIGNEVIGITSALIDITDIKEAQRKIKKQAFTDALTQISNRTALYDYMKNESDYSNIGMMLVDIDNFKDINDYYGHNFGDKVIVHVANELKKICNDAFICRFGGDEFLAVFKGVENENIICDKAEKILEKIHMYKEHDFSVSIGIAIGDDISDINRLLVKVDLAMYKSKELGKNRFMKYTKELEAEKNLTLNIEKDLKYAIAKNEVKVFYQPQYTIDRKLKGFEALFRWKSKKYANVPVIKIIEVMESSNLIIDMGYYIMREACKFAKKINENRKDKIVVSINISAIQIMEKDFIKKVKSIINKTGVYIDCIGIEITETVLVKNIEENIMKIKELKDMGVTISLDDFGTGYSSLNYIVNMPLSLIKIDKSFISGMNVKKEYIKLLRLIIASAHSLNLPIVAEGVETEEQLAKLNKMNVDYVQGFLFSKPVEEEKAFKLLELK
ncbi:diguanylate cyclase [Clostridium botulinum]|uniref:Stage 0 sporulation protein A homolog n=2 Tax=Clostridium botulinum TaxID=1491 RepID=A0A6M0SNU4_CLOBO|nr:EAL domain-containing protein [Clostridium botulinum]ACD53981.1 diguanylate cyclase/phosphodiesterase domain 2 [Clostridium botulinum E3 str. Alaska E43]AJF29405.1 diguanylate cyclase [Clostridium botulinum]AJF32466.1 diguanylate cyclase [Clostridium botulinum]MBN1077402.1 EAL domain-containing protein [Clostridium botulinum]MBY6789456.1 EAL domain-containing protein [Clostridium botulinum]